MIENIANREKLNVRIKLEGKELEKFEVVSKFLGIKTGTDLFMHLLAEEFNKIKAC